MTRHAAAPVARIGDTPDPSAEAGGGHGEFESLEAWLEWVNRTGGELIEELHRLYGRMAGIRAAMIATTDGFNVCSLGIDPDTVSQLAALVGSLQSLANASARTLIGAHAGGAEHVIVTVQETVFLAAAIDDRTDGASTDAMYLLVAAERTSLAVLMVHVRTVTERIRQRLAQA